MNMLWIKWGFEKDKPVLKVIPSLHDVSKLMLQSYRERVARELLETGRCFNIYYEGLTDPDLQTLLAECRAQGFKTFVNKEKNAFSVSVSASEYDAKYSVEIV